MGAKGPLVSHLLFFMATQPLSFSWTHVNPHKEACLVLPLKGRGWGCYTFPCGTGCNVNAKLGDEQFSSTMGETSERKSDMVGESVCPNSPLCNHMEFWLSPVTCSGQRSENKHETRYKMFAHCFLSSCEALGAPKISRGTSTKDP